MPTCPHAHMPTCPHGCGHLTEFNANEFICQTNSIVPDITSWMLRARQGDRDAFSRLFDFYFQRLTIYLRGQLVPPDRAAGFEEDLVSESMAGFWQDLSNGRFGHITNRDELWFALMRVAKSCAVDRRKYLSRKKRLVDEAIGWAAFLKNKSELRSDNDEIEFMDDWDSFTKTLPDEQFRQIIDWKLNGFVAKEIAERMGTIPRIVHRKLQFIRVKWEQFVSVKYHS